MNRTFLGFISVLAGLALLAGVAAIAAPQAEHGERSPLVVLTGNDSKVSKLAFRRIGSAADWKTTWLSHLGLKQDTIYRPALEVDFNRCDVVAMFQGKWVNTCGFRVESVRDAHGVVVVRIDAITYQTAGPDGGADRVTPYAFIVLPKSDKEIVLERNVQQYIGHPPEWKEVARLASEESPAALQPNK